MAAAGAGAHRRVEARAVGALPLVAIGGLTRERAAACLAAGADVVAVVGDIVRHADPEASLRAWLDATRCPA
ncbi:thiamine phosphate synthase [Rhodanobacter sp. FW106-PBR-R2A-1-13]|uniref:thiamine phosphate synthase n=1 Tax=Rhodanobacter sp. FW106-PBR-R2A-1-13 TaxID=3454845 RepID=UPI0034E5347A